MSFEIDVHRLSSREWIDEERLEDSIVQKYVCTRHRAASLQRTH